MLKKIVLMILSISIIGCSGGKMEEQKMNYKKLADTPASAWETLSKKTIYFGHQSVGFNMMDGIVDLLKENPQIKLNVVETSNPSEFTPGVFAHSRVGKNVNPESKIKEFVKFMDDGIGGKADIAFFKFCFVDIHSGTDLQNVFEEYKTKMAEMEKKYSSTRFVHVSVPLTSQPDGFKGVLKRTKDFIKQIIGKINMYDNKVKYKYNEMLRKEYSDEKKLFDLAMVEATSPDGSKVLFSNGDNSKYALYSGYTDDGGHLDSIGRKHVAEQLLLFLVNLNEQ